MLMLFVFNVVVRGWFVARNVVLAMVSMAFAMLCVSS